MKGNIRHGFWPFIVVWNDMQGLGCPRLHLRMATWLEQNWRKKNKNLLLMAFRSSGKSTLVGLFAAWLLHMNPDLRILVLAADLTLASKMVQQVRKIIELHPLTKNLKPQKPEQWAADRFTVQRNLKLRDPSMMAKGISANITGSHADVIICDDVEVPRTCETPDKRETLRAKLAEISYVMVPGGTQLYTGTPHTYYSIYSEQPRFEDDSVFLDGFKRLRIPVLNEQGESAWPEKFTGEDIKAIAARHGPNKFASQMMLRPVNIIDARLDSSLLNIYDDELDYTKELRTLFLGRKKIASASGWWDPAFGSKDGDNSVFAVLFTDESGNYYVHHVEYIKAKANTVNAAENQCAQIAVLAKKLYLPALTIESNGIGKFLPGILRNEMAKAKSPCAVKEFSNSCPKDVRILEAFDALLAARKIHIHKSVLATPLITEMDEWRPGLPKSRDDGLDAVAGAISQTPARMERLFNNARHPWRGKHHKAKSEFEV